MITFICKNSKIFDKEIAKRLREFNKSKKKSGLEIGRIKSKIKVSLLLMEIN